MTARCALYKLIERTVAEIWPFEIIQDGGLAACRQLRFHETGNSAIRSAYPENHTLEPNMKCIGSPVADGHSRILWGIYGTPILGEGEVVDGQRWHHSTERWWFPIGSPL